MYFPHKPVPLTKVPAANWKLREFTSRSIFQRRLKKRGVTNNINDVSFSVPGSDDSVTVSQHEYQDATVITSVVFGYDKPLNSDTSHSNRTSWIVFHFKPTQAPVLV